jgi:hypothetical protein
VFVSFLGIWCAQRFPASEQRYFNVGRSHGLHQRTAIPLKSSFGTYFQRRVVRTNYQMNACCPNEIMSRRPRKPQNVCFLMSENKDQTFPIAGAGNKAEPCQGALMGAPFLSISIISATSVGATVYIPATAVSERPQHWNLMKGWRISSPFRY